MFITLPLTYSFACMLFVCLFVWLSVCLSGHVWAIRHRQERHHNAQRVWGIAGQDRRGASQGPHEARLCVHRQEQGWRRVHIINHNHNQPQPHQPRQQQRQPQQQQVHEIITIVSWWFSSSQSSLSQKLFKHYLNIKQSAVKYTR